MLSILLFSCNGKEVEYSKSIKELFLESRLDSSYSRYAEGFDVWLGKDYKIIEIKSNPQLGLLKQYYLLSDKSYTVNKEDYEENVQSIQTPVESLVLTSTTQISLLEHLGKLELLKGFPNPNYISSSEALRLVKEGSIIDLGSDVEINMEALLMLHPDLMVTYTYKGESSDHSRLIEAGIPVIYNLEFAESHPLGKAEWIKFIALFIDEEARADSVFSFVENEYLAIKKLVKTDQKPTVMTGVVYGDSWYMPGGKNHMSVLFADAGGSYIWKADSSSSSLQLGFESVYEKCKDVDFWIGTSDFSSLNQLKSQDDRYSNFKAFKEGNVFNYNKRITENGGNDYFEQGYVRPDIVLKDLAYILHPDLFKDYQLYFYQKLDQ